MADESVPSITTDPPDQTNELSTNDMLKLLLEEQQQHRAEIAAMRVDLDAARKPMPRQTSIVMSPEELAAARMELINAHDFYCPGCGLFYDYQRECTGRGEAPHPAIDVVSTDELRAGDPSKHTEAPGIHP